jgi:hypothetical protein
VLLEVSRAASYAHHAAVPSARQRADDELTEHIRQAHQGSKGGDGAPPMNAKASWNPGRFSFGDRASESAR